MVKFDKFAKLYFELDDICKTAIDNITRAEQKAQTDIAYQRELLREDKITNHGFNTAKEQINNELIALKESIKPEIRGIQARFNAAVDEYMLPTIERYIKADADMLAAIKLTPDEFKAYAQKYKGNPTMEKVLDKHRAENGIETYWKPESGEALKADFNNLVAGLESSINLKDKDAISRFISSHYHKIGCSNPEHLKYDGEDDAAPIEAPRTFF